MKRRNNPPPPPKKKVKTNRTQGNSFLLVNAYMYISSMGRNNVAAVLDEGGPFLSRTSIKVDLFSLPIKLNVFKNT